METLAASEVKPADVKPAGIVRGTLELLHVRAAAECAGRQDIRYYLNGVCVELHPSAVILVATDGHRLLAARDSGEAPTFEGCAGPLRFFVENDALVQIISTFGKSKLPRFAFAFDLSTGMVEFTGGAGLRISISAGTDTAASFPSWRRVVPAKPSGVQAQFDPRYLCSASKVAALFSGRKSVPMMRIDHNGESGAVITFGAHHQVVLVLMPYRVTDECKLEWLEHESKSRGEGWR